MRLRPPFVLLIGLTTRAASASPETDNFREDVMACEEAVARLASCCESFRAVDARCVYDRHHEGPGCDSYDVYHEDPMVSPDEAACVLANDCATLRDGGVCERAVGMIPERGKAHHEIGQTTTPDVAKNAVLCP